MASFKVAFKQGFNLISIPLDMTGASYEDDPRELFPAYLQTSYIPNEGFTGNYVFTRISNGVDSYINIDGKWHFVGESGSEWTSITTSQGLSILVNVSEPNGMLKKTFHGDTISSPQNIQYNLKEGWNIVSYPYEIDQHFGEGSYSTTAHSSQTNIDFCLNNNYLKGSGHSDACITRIISKKGEITNPKFAFGLNYDGSGSDSSDWNKPDDLQELENFITGSAVILYSDSDKTSINLWSNTSQNNNDNYNFLLGTTGITTAQTSGNRGMNTFSATAGGFYNPSYGSHFLASRFIIIHGGSLNDPTGTEHTFKIKDASGSNIFSAQKQSNGRYQSSTSSTEYVMGFFVDRLFNLDSNKPNWGNRGYIRGFGHYSQQDETVNSIGDLGMEHTSIGSLLSTYPNNVTGVPDNDAPMRYVKVPTDGSNDVVDFSFFNGLQFAGISGMVPHINLKMDSYYFNITSFVNLEKDLATGFIPNDYAVPVIYDPTATDGQRYRYCKYYPHKNDRGREIDGSGGYRYFRDHPEYHDIFYDENQNYKFDSVLGDPYIQPVYKRFPYKLYDPESLATSKSIHGIIHGIFQML